MIRDATAKESPHFNECQVSYNGLCDGYKILIVSNDATIVIYHLANQYESLRRGYET
jgi:hypothetical protein